jgi:hypothetical protein
MSAGLTMNGSFRKGPYERNPSPSGRALGSLLGYFTLPDRREPLTSTFGA